MYYNEFAKDVKEVSENFSNIIEKLDVNYVHKGKYLIIEIYDYVTYVKVKILDVKEQVIILHFNIEKSYIQNTKKYFYDAVLEQLKYKISYYYNMQLALEDIEHTI